MVPWTLYRYIMGELLRITFLGILAVSLLYTTLAAYQTVHSGLQLSFIWPLLLKTFAYPLYYSLPISFLFAVTLVLGRMTSDLEITAMHTNGLSYRQIYAPVLILAAALAGVSFYVTGWVVPDIHYAKRNLQTYLLGQLDNLGSGINRTIRLPGNEGALWVGAYRGKDLRRVRVDFKPSRNSNILPALRGTLPSKSPSSVRIIANQGHVEVLPEKKKVLLSLKAVQILVPEPIKTASVANEVFHQKVAISDNIVIPLSFDKKPPGIKDHTTPELFALARRLRAPERPVVEQEGEAGIVRASYRSPAERARDRARADIASTELNRRLAFTLSCLTFAFLGVSLALFLDRWGRLVAFFAGNLVVIAVYYPLVVLGVYLGENVLWPSISLALPNIAVLSLGIYLSRKVVHR